MNLVESLVRWFTPRRSAAQAGAATGTSALFSRAVGEGERDLRPNGLPCPNSKAAERVRRFLVEERMGAKLCDLAEEEGWKARRFYAESQGESPLSWDFVDKIGGRLPLAERLALARFLVVRWGLKAEVGPLPSLED